MVETLHQAARFLVPSWPLLAACLLALLPLARANASARLFSLTGMMLTLCLTPLLPGQDSLARWGCVLAGCVPFLAWHPGQKRLASCLVLLACFVITLALCTHRVLLVACLTACGALLLALEETLKTARARQAWESMRLRLAGLILTLLGTSLITLSPDPALLRLGDLFLAIGLCLLIGLGTFGATRSATEAEPETALLDLLLCLSAVALMLRLPSREITHLVLLFAGLAGLWLCVLTRQDGPRALVALATLASASSAGMLPAMLFMSAGFALAAMPRLAPPMRHWIQVGLPPWPGFAASGLMIASLLGSHVVIAISCLLAHGVLASRARMIWVLPQTWRDRAIVMALLALGLVAPIGLVMSHATSPDWPLSWMAP